MKTKTLFIFTVSIIVIVVVLGVLLAQVAIKEMKQHMNSSTIRIVKSMLQTPLLNMKRGDYKNQCKIEELNDKIRKLRSGFKKGFYIESPISNLIYQREDGGITVPYYIITNSDSKSIATTLYNSKGSIIQSSNESEGEFKYLNAGMYRMIVSDGIESSEIVFGVGDLYLVAGQSNAVSSAQMHPAMASASQLVSVTNVYSNVKSGPFDMIIPSDDNKIRSNICWLYCGDLLANNLNIPIGFVNVSYGSTSTMKWNPKVDYLSNSIEQVLNFTKVKAILWHQGESDVVEHVPFSISYSNLKELILFSRKFQPDLNWVVAINSFKPDEEYDTNSIRNAQKRIISEGLALKGPDTDTIRENPNWTEESGAEFVGNGLKVHGELWFRVLTELFYRTD